MKQPSSPRSHAHHRSDIGRLRRAGPWALAEAFISAFATFLSTLIVARILTPHDFGLATIAFAVVALIQMIALAGLPEAMLRMPTLVTAISDQVFWTMLFFGIAGTAIGWMIAWPLALFYESPLVFWLIAVQAVDCVLLALIQFPTVLLTRKMRIRSLAVRALGFKAASIAVTIAVAFAGGGPWALVAGTLTGSVVSVVMLWTTQSRLPSWRPPGREIAGILRTSALIMAEASLTSLAIRGFILLFGKFHGLAALGLLNFANRLVDELGNMLSSAVNRVAVTFLSSIRRKGGSLVRAFELGSFGMTALVAPMFFGLAAVAPDIVPLIFGEHWNPAVPAVQLLAIAWSIRLTRVMGASLMRTINAQGPLVVNAAVMLVYCMVAVWISQDWGFVLAAGAYAARMLVILPAGVAAIARAGVPVRRQIGSVTVPLGLAAAMAVAVSALRLTAPLSDLGPFQRALVCAVAGALVYSAALFALTRQQVLALARIARPPSR